MEPKTELQTVQVVEVIRVVQTTGTGSVGNPTRIETSYWSTDGQLLARMNINDDPYSLLRRS